MLLAASLTVAVEDEVTVSTIEVTVGGGIHRHLCTILNTPNLKATTQTTCKADRTSLNYLSIDYQKLSAHSYLDLALAIIHHAMLGCHGPVGVQGGGVEGHLLHFGDAANGVGLAGTCSLIFVPPVAEELLEQSRLSSSWKYLNLQERRVREGYQAMFKYLHFSTMLC